MVANAWLRSGDSVSLSSYKAFLQETFEEVLQDHPIGLVRADSGFYANELLTWLENKDLNYIIAVKFYTNIGTDRILRKYDKISKNPREKKNH